MSLCENYIDKFENMIVKLFIFGKVCGIQRNYRKTIYCIKLKHSFFTVFAFYAKKKVSITSEKNLRSTLSENNKTLLDCLSVYFPERIYYLHSKGAI